MISEFLTAVIPGVEVMTGQPSFYQDPFDNAFPQCSQQAGLDSGRWALVTSGDNMGKLYTHWARVAETLRLRPKLWASPHSYSKHPENPAKGSWPCPSAALTPFMAVKEWAALLTQGTLCASLSGAFV